jgi:GNAT superfamily N-acetyltransferase
MSPPRPSVTTEFPIARLSSRDVPDNVALARSVGWPDAEDDWRILHASAVVLGVRHDGRLVAQGALGLYGTAGTIAKMIVAPEFQRRHLGGRLLDALLEEAHRRSIDVLGLVATPAGRPLYEQRGFTPVGEVVVLMGTPAPAATAAAQPLSPLEDANVAPGIEERWLSCSRASMLRARFSKAIATASVLASDGTVVGYGMATAQGPLATVGPVMAETEEDARALITALLGSVSAPVRVDVPSDQAGFRQWLLRVGLREQAVRVEMALGAPRLPWQVPQRFALAAQAWG